MIEYQIVRSARRKTLSLQVKQGKVFVRAPYYVDKKTISALVHEKSVWLKAKISEQSQITQQYFNFEHNSKLLFLGKSTLLQVSFEKSSKTYLLQQDEQLPELHIVLPSRYQDKLQDKALLAIAIKKQLERFFKQQAHTKILPKVTNYSVVTNLKPSAIKIRQYSARWGSCNSRGELSFNYLMMMMPDYVIDYVVVHELCHLQFLNHSTDFWQLVDKHFPAYKEAKQWLKDHQSQLQWRLP